MGRRSGGFPLLNWRALNFLFDGGKVGDARVVSHSAPLSSSTDADGTLLSWSGLSSLSLIQHTHVRNVPNFQHTP